MGAGWALASPWGWAFTRPTPPSGTPWFLSTPALCCDYGWRVGQEEGEGSGKPACHTLLLLNKRRNQISSRDGQGRGTGDVAFLPLNLLLLWMQASCSCLWGMVWLVSWHVPKYSVGKAFAEQVWGPELGSPEHSSVCQASLSDYKEIISRQENPQKLAGQLA